MTSCDMCACGGAGGMLSRARRVSQENACVLSKPRPARCACTAFSCLLAPWRLAAGVLFWWLAPNFVACKVVSVYRVVRGVSIWPLVLGGCSCVDAVRCGCLSRVKRCVCVLSRCVRADASCHSGLGVRCESECARVGWVRCRAVNDKNTAC